MYLTAESIGKLNKLLNLPYKEYMQDWELELADPERVDEFIGHMYDEGFSENDKYALMSLIIASYDDYICLYGVNDEKWAEIEDLLDKDAELYMYLLHYWALEEEKDADNVFPITHSIRGYLHKTHKSNPSAL